MRINKQTYNKLLELKNDNILSLKYKDTPHLSNLFKIQNTEFMLSIGYFEDEDYGYIEIFKDDSRGYGRMYTNLEDLPKYNNNKVLKEQVNYIKDLISNLIK